MMTRWRKWCPPKFRPITVKRQNGLPGWEWSEPGKMFLVHGLSDKAVLSHCSSSQGRIEAHNECPWRSGNSLFQPNSLFSDKIKQATLLGVDAVPVALSSSSSRHPSGTCEEESWSVDTVRSERTRSVPNILIPKFLIIKKKGQQKGCLTCIWIAARFSRERW